MTFSGPKIKAFLKIILKNATKCKYINISNIFSTLKWEYTADKMGF